MVHGSIQDCYNMPWKYFGKSDKHLMWCGSLLLPSHIHVLFSVFGKQAFVFVLCFISRCQCVFITSIQIRLLMSAEGFLTSQSQRDVDVKIVLLVMCVQSSVHVVLSIHPELLFPMFHLVIMLRGRLIL